jgi:hypothetical protein
MTDRVKKLRFVSPVERVRIIRELDYKHMIPIYRDRRKREKLPPLSYAELKYGALVALHKSRLALDDDTGVTKSEKAESTLWLAQRELVASGVH